MTDGTFLTTGPFIAQPKAVLNLRSGTDDGSAARIHHRATPQIYFGLT